MALATLSIMNSAYSNILETIKWDLALNYTQSGALNVRLFPRIHAGANSLGYNG